MIAPEIESMANNLMSYGTANHCLSGGGNLFNVSTKVKVTLYSSALCRGDPCVGAGIAQPVLTSALDWSASRPCRITPVETDPGTHWIGGWVGLNAGLEGLKKRKILNIRQSNPVKLTTHLHLMPRSRMVELYLHSPIWLHGIVHN
jgi:hypothetical protein